MTIHVRSSPNRPSTTTTEAALPDLYVPGQKHRVRLWLRGGPPEGITYLVDFATGPDWVPPPGFDARFNCMVNLARAKVQGTSVNGSPVEDAEDGMTFFWGEVSCMRYEGTVQPAPKLVTATGRAVA